MTESIFKDRERALEYEFFHRVDVQLLEHLRHEMKEKASIHALAESSGILDQATLSELVELGVDPPRLLALSLVPLIHVAWADGSIAPEERRAILDAAHALGHASDQPSYRLLETWLEKEPGEEYLQAWRDYIGALQENLTAKGRSALRREILERCRFVADAAGGVFGVWKTSGAEAQAIAEIESALVSD